MSAPEILREPWAHTARIPGPRPDAGRGDLRSAAGPVPRGRNREGDRLGLLDLARFGAAFLVVAYHFTARKHEAFGIPVGQVFPDVGSITVFGALGVELFFLISGFVILKSVWGRTTQDFVASRVSRLFPAYWCAVVITATVMIVIRPEPLGDGLTLGTALGNLTMVQSAYGVGHVDGVYWTLWTELRFYFLVGLLSLVGITRGRVIAFAALWPVLAGIAAESGSAFLSTLLVGPESLFFSAGMLLYLIYREGHTAWLWMLVGMQWALAMAYSGTDLAARLERYTGQDVAPWAVMATVTLMFLVVVLATLAPPARWDWRWMSFAGALTYPLYLVHENWGWVAIRALHEPLGQVPALIVTIALVLAAAAAIHLLVERPLAPRLREAVRRGLHGPAPTTRRDG